jgi:hypothetical protein
MYQVHKAIQFSHQMIPITAYAWAYELLIACMLLQLCSQEVARFIMIVVVEILIARSLVF